MMPESIPLSQWSYQRTTSALYALSMGASASTRLSMYSFFGASIPS